MSKKDLSERDICTKLVTPALAQSQWDVQGQIREQVYFTKGRIIVRGKLVTRGKTRRQTGYRASRRIRGPAACRRPPHGC
jgi:type I restriction enzyme R subunit